jgi:hypothetical protein
MNDMIASRLNRLQRGGMVLAFLGLGACCLGAAVDARQFFISYLVGYTFWLGLSLGCLGVAMIHHLTGGRWGFVTRRFLEAGFMTLPWMALLFIPLLFGLRELYPWARPDAVTASETLRQKTIYLNRPWFCARTAVFVAIWLWMAFCLRRWSLQQDASADPAPTIKLRALSGPGIVIYPLTATFAFVDWVMSSEPHWYSTIFPVIMLIGQILSAFAFVTLLLAWFREQTPFREVAIRTHFHDLGNLLLAFVIFWTYVSFSQLLIIYSGNLPREIDWYLFRIAGGWKWVIVLLALFHFFVPFFLLLFRVMKQNVARLTWIAALIFAVHIVEVYWTIEPAFFRAGLHVHWLDAAAVLGLGGVWLAVFSANLKRHALLPQNDPRIEYSVVQTAHAN